MFLKYVTNLRDCNHASALATNPSGAVLLGLKVQHVVPISAYTPPCSANNISISIYSFNLIRGKLYELLLIMIYVIYPNNICIHIFYMVDNQNRTDSNPAVI